MNNNNKNTAKNSRRFHAFARLVSREICREHPDYSLAEHWATSALQRAAACDFGSLNPFELVNLLLNYAEILFRLRRVSAACQVLARIKGYSCWTLRRTGHIDWWQPFMVLDRMEDLYVKMENFEEARKLNAERMRMLEPDRSPARVTPYSMVHNREQIESMKKQAGLARARVETARHQEFLKTEQTIRLVDPVMRTHAKNESGELPDPYEPLPGLISTQPLEVVE